MVPTPPVQADPPKVALLIDADNIALDNVDKILQFCQQQGIVRLSHAYGDWETPPLATSKLLMKQHQIKTVQQNRCVKNATDMGLAFGAGGILHSSDVTLFVIVSGDNHLLTVHNNIREAGKQTIGVGHKEQTSEALVKQCGNFVFIEDLDRIIQRSSPHIEPKPPGKPAANSDPKTAGSEHPEDSLIGLITRICLENGQANGWTSMSMVGNVLHKLEPRLSERFGQKRLSTRLKELNAHFEINNNQVRPVNNKAPIPTGKIAAPAPTPRTAPQPAKKAQPGDNSMESLIALIHRAYRANHRKDGWARMSALGNAISQLEPQFKQRFGKQPLSVKLKTLTGHFEVNGDRVRPVGQKIAQPAKKAPPPDRKAATPAPNSTLKPAQPGVKHDHAAESLLALINRAYVEHVQPNGWANLAMIGMSLRKLEPQLDQRFGKKSLSDRLKGFQGHIEIRSHEMCVINLTDPHSLLKQSYMLVCGADGRAHMSRVGEILRKIDPHYHLHFGTKSLSSWLKQYPHTFSIMGDYVQMR